MASSAAFPSGAYEVYHADHKRPVFDEHNACVGVYARNTLRKPEVRLNTMPQPARAVGTNTARLLLSHTGRRAGAVEDRARVVQFEILDRAARGSEL
jgi:hypothetical protein